MSHSPVSVLEKIVLIEQIAPPTNGLPVRHAAFEGPFVVEMHTLNTQDQQAAGLQVFHYVAQRNVVPPEIGNVAAELEFGSGVNHEPNTSAREDNVELFTE